VSIQHSTSCDFDLLISLVLTLFTAEKKITKNANAANVTLHVLQISHCKFSPYLSSRFTIDYNRYLGNGDLSFTLDRCAYIANFFFGLSSSLTKKAIRLNSKYT
jgi:hypothetical protein